MTPQPGHLNPVIVRKKHGIQKDVYRTINAYAMPAAKINASVFPLLFDIRKFVDLVLNQRQRDDSSEYVQDQVKNASV